MPQEVTQNLTSSDLTRALKHLGITMSHGDFDKTLRERAGDGKGKGQAGRAERGAPPGVALPNISKVHSTLDVLGTIGAKQPNTVTRKLMSNAPSVGKTLRAKLEEGMKRNWKRLQKEFRVLDPGRTGLLEVAKFLRCLAQAGLALTTDEIDLLYVQHGHGDSAKVWYMDFLKNYLSSVSYQSVLASLQAPEAKETASASARGSAPASTVAAVRPMATPAGEAGERVRFMREIAQCWKQVRQACLLVDTGKVKGLRREQVKAVLLRLGHTAKQPLLDEVLGIFTTREGLVDYNMLIKHACQEHLPTL